MNEDAKSDKTATGDVSSQAGPSYDQASSATSQSCDGASSAGQRIWNPYSQSPGAAAEPSNDEAVSSNDTVSSSQRAAESSASFGATDGRDWGYVQPSSQAYAPGFGQASAGSSYGANAGASASGPTAQTPPSGFNAQPTGQKPPKKPKKPIPPRAKTFAAGFAGAALACVISLGAYTAINGGTTSTVTLGGSGSSITVSGEDANLGEVVAQKVSPSVVSIETYVSKTSATGIASASSSNNLTQYGAGSGVIISADGYIVTNYHVIENTNKVMVSTGEKEYEAKVVGTDQSSDLAVLKIEANNLTAIEVGSSDGLKVGEWCMAVGSAFGLGQSVSTGIVSATNCTYDELNDETGSAIYANMVQTDAAVNPGNSGGALVDKDGKFIGVTTMGATYSGDNSGVNFAIPVDYVMTIAQQIIDGKTPTHAQMGVTMNTINEQTAGYYGLSVTEGAYVTSVASKSGADKAGMKSGDIVTAIDGDKVSSALDVILAIRSHKTGDTLKVTINRDGSEQTLDVTLGSDS